MNENQNQEFDFLKEKIKEKPINKKKLLRRTLITASMAVLFALVACLTFLLLEPVISNWLYPEEEPQIVTFPEEEEEIMPEDMLLEDPEPKMTEEVTEISTSALPEPELEIEDYHNLYTKLASLAKEAGRSVVTVTSVTSDVDWFDNTYESKGQTSGVILADNGKELIIIVKKKPIENADAIRVTFCDGKQAEAVVKKDNKNTGLVALGVEWALLQEDTKEKIKVAIPGSSGGSALLGMPVMAIGSPIGYSNSLGYGMITSTGNLLQMEDYNYNLMTTDIVGSENASGVLINLNGEIIGILHQESNSEDKMHVLSALGISELKQMIGKMSNAQDIAYLGLYTQNVTKEANEELGVPKGVYVSEIAMDSPAMKAGIQSGDIVVKINDSYTDNTSDYTSILNELKPEDTITVTVMRQSKEEYQEVEFSIVLAQLPK